MISHFRDSFCAIFMWLLLTAFRKNKCWDFSSMCNTLLKVSINFLMSFWNVSTKSLTFFKRFLTNFQDICYMFQTSFLHAPILAVHFTMHAKICKNILQILIFPNVTQFGIQPIFVRELVTVRHLKSKYNSVTDILYDRPLICVNHVSNMRLTLK